MPKTSSPTSKRVTPPPTLVTSPQTSQPTVIGKPPMLDDAPRPIRDLKSTGLTPAARTRTWTSVGIGSGASTPSSRSTSGPPNSCWTIAFTRPILGRDPERRGRGCVSLRSLSLKWLSRIAVDVQPLRESRDFRLLTMGSLITGLGTQATLVALPYQVFVITGSAFLVGLIGAAELGPLIIASLFGGALADRFDRRPMLLLCQLALVASAAALAVAAALGPPPVWILFVLAAAMAGASAIERVVRSAIVPNTVSAARLPAAISLTYGLYQLTMVVGPGLGGVLISIFGLTVPYSVDAVSCLGMAAGAGMMSAQPPTVAARGPEPG